MSHLTEGTYAVYRERRTRARKAHRCDACNETIESGHLYMRVSWVFDRRASGVKRCLRCQALHEHLRELCGRNAWPDEWLACGLSYETEWGPCPPEVAALAFTSGGEMQGGNS